MHQIIMGFIVRDGLTDRDIVVGKEAWWVDVAGPHLAEEIDEQAWLINRLMTTPQGEIINPTEATCARANGWMASSWSAADYAEMEQGKAGIIYDGAPSISEDKARDRLCEMMRYSSEPITVTASPDPWSLRGDRVVVPDLDPEPEVMDPEVALQAADDVLDAMVEQASVKYLLAVSDVVLESTAAMLVECDDLLGRMLAASMQRPKKPSGVTNMDEDDEEEEEAYIRPSNRPSDKPPVQKPVEPPFRPMYDDWGFPISYPPAKPAHDSEPPQSKGEPTPEEPVASPSADQLGTAESAHAASQGVGSPSHYESIEPALRAVVIEERGMKTRIQLTGYLKGKYVQGQADNFIVPDIMAEAVRTALEPISEVARRNHEAAVGAGTALAKGGPRVRVQLTEYASKGGEYLRQDGSKVGYNLTVPDMTVAAVAELIDHQLATHFGVRRGDAAALVQVWGAFMGEPAREIEDGSAGPVEGGSAKDERGASNSVVEKSPNTVQGALLDGHGDVRATTGEFLAVLLPDLLNRPYDKRLHLGLCAVVTGSMLRVIGLWEREADAKVAARRAGGRVVDAQGFLVPQGEVDTAEIAPDEARA
jgi:hypothetical protein